MKFTYSNDKTHFFYIGYSLSDNDPYTKDSIDITLFKKSLRIRFDKFKLNKFFKKKVDCFQTFFSISLTEDYVGLCFRDKHYFFDYFWKQMEYIDRHFLTNNHTFEKFSSDDIDALTKNELERVFFKTGTFEYTPKFQRNVQTCEYKTFVYVQHYKFKYFPFLKKSFYRANIDFTKEMGERVDTWKGGTLSMSFQIKDVNEFLTNHDTHITQHLRG